MVKYNQKTPKNTIATFLFPFFYNMETEKLQKVAQNYYCKKRY
jgi:hypothetical protein